MKARKYKRGDIRGDGMVFVKYEPGCVDGEYWVTKKKFNDIIKQIKKRKSKREENLKEAYKLHPRKYKRGDVRSSDNWVFWSYKIDIKGFELWLPRNKWKKYEGIKKNTRRKYQNTRRKTDPLYKLAGSMRCLINQAFRIQNYKKDSQAREIIGCSFTELKKHLQLQFAEGMTWQNAGDWHIDHKLPLAAATTKDELIKLNHYTNLQPLWAKDNLCKGDKYSPSELKRYLARHPNS